MDWTSILTILATGLVTTAGVVAKGEFDARADRRRIAAEDKRAKDQMARADAAALVASAEKATEAGREAGRIALGVFTDMLSQIQAYARDISYESVEMHWQRDFDAKARQTSELIYSEPIRDQMNVVVSAMAEFNTFGYVSNLGNAQWNAVLLMTHLVSLAGCATRGDSPDRELITRLDAVTAGVAAIKQYWIDHPEVTATTPTTADTS